MAYISYEEFGVNFVALAVTPERVRDAVAEVAGDTFEVGPMPAGPGGVAVVTARGRIGPPQIEQVTGPILSFEARLLIDLSLEVRLATVPQRYKGRVEVPLSLRVRTVEPLMLKIEVDPVTASDVGVDLQPEGMSAGMLQRVGNIDDEVRSAVTRIVNERLGSEKSRDTREINVASLIDKALSAD